MKIIESNPKKMREIGFRELRLKADDVVQAVRDGESFIVKRNSQSLFRIVPLEEEVWETAIDFTQIDKQGVGLDEVLSAIEELKQEHPKRYGRSGKKVSR
jgi:antitoxin (DNA-binding transcriptional repressor) of toxin-antitoxin stability system